MSLLKCGISFLLSAFVVSIQAYSQNIKSLINSDSIYSISDEKVVEMIRNMPNIEVGKGVTFMPKDNWYKMTMRFRMQNMVGMSFDDKFSLEKTEAQVKRLRLRFDGYIYSPKLTYSIQLGFTPYDSKELPNGNVNIVRDAMVYYIPSSTWNIGFGQTKIKANRARINSSSALQFVDRSIVNSEFNIDRDFGFFGEYNKRLFSDFNIVGKGSITSGDGRNYQSSSKSGFAYTGRLEVYPIGRFKAYGDVFEGDYQREETPKFLLAGAYSFNDRALRVKGQTGDLILNNQRRNISSWYADFIFKYSGFAFYADWMGRGCKNSFIYNSDDKIVQNVFTGQGINLQTSYLLPSKWEFALRNSTILPSNDIKSFVGYDSYNQSTLGVTKYLIGHSLKIQADASYNYKKGMSSDLYNRYEIRFQVELGF
ncbi:MAG: porin [Bacteroidales bacterium]|nr:porin [Bacteroidales bacterium]